MPGQTAESWHLDKKVPLAIIVALAVQTTGLVWWGATWSAKMDSRIQVVETILPTLQPKSLCVEQHSLLDSRIHHVESQGVSRFENVSKRLDRIDSKLDRLLESASYFNGNRNH